MFKISGKSFDTLRTRTVNKKQKQSPSGFSLHPVTLLKRDPSTDVFL